MHCGWYINQILCYQRRNWAMGREIHCRGPADALAVHPNWHAREAGSQEIVSGDHAADIGSDGYGT